jgi:hypothetical protein
VFSVIAGWASAKKEGEEDSKFAHDRIVHIDWLIDACRKERTRIGAIWAESRRAGLPRLALNTNVSWGRMKSVDIELGDFLVYVDGKIRCYGRDVFNDVYQVVNDSTCEIVREE